MTKTKNVSDLTDQPTNQHICIHGDCTTILADHCDRHKEPALVRPSLMDQIQKVHEDIEMVADWITVNPPWSQSAMAREIFWLNRQLQALYQLRMFEDEIEAARKR
jgi:hypothetical protein